MFAPLSSTDETTRSSGCRYPKYSSRQDYVDALGVIKDRKLDQHHRGSELDGSRPQGSVNLRRQGNLTCQVALTKRLRSDIERPYYAQEHRRLQTCILFGFIHVYLLHH